MSPQTRRRSDLPYDMLAGVEPCPRGWLVAPAKFLGATLSADSPYVVAAFREILDAVPAFAVVGVHIPIGLPDEPMTGGRTCDREARKLLGWPRLAAIRSAPGLRVLEGGTHNHRRAAALNGGHLDVITYRLLPKIAEVAGAIQPYHQRHVFEVEPELAFFHLSGDRPMRFGKTTPAGQQERDDLLRGRIPGADRILDARIPGVTRRHLVDACADLWTARRIAGRAVIRLPERPEWNSQGLRMELLR